MPLGALGSIHRMCTEYSETSQIIAPTMSSAFSIKTDKKIVINNVFTIPRVGKVGPGVPLSCRV